MGVPTFPLDLDLSDALRSVRTLQRQIQEDFSALNVDIDISNATSQELDGILERVRGIGGTRFDGLASSIEQLQSRTRAAEQDASRLGQAFEDLNNNQIAPRFNLAELDDFRSGLRAIDGATPEIRAKFDADEIRDAEQILGRINSSNPAVRATVDASEVEELRSLIERIERETIDLDVDVDDAQVDRELGGIAQAVGRSGIAAAITAAVVGGFNEARAGALDGILTGFAEDSAEYEAIGRARGELVVRGIVGSYEDAQPVVIAAARALGEGFSDTELLALSEQLVIVEQQLGVNTQQAAELVAIQTSQGFAEGPSEALDNLLTTAQNSNLEVSELAELWVEYAGRVDAATIPTEDFIGILAAADTRFGADKLIDSFSEFVIKVGEGSDDTRASFDQLGISYDDTLDRINAGDGTDAFSDVLAQLDQLDATQQRVLGEPLIGSVGIDQIGALASANIEAIQSEANITAEAAAAVNDEWTRIRSLIEDPVNADRFSEATDVAAGRVERLFSDFSLSTLNDAFFGFGSGSDPTQDIDDLAEALEDFANGLNTADGEARSGAAGIGAYRNRLEEARVEAAGFEDDLFNIFTQGDAFRRQRFEVEFFADVDDPETQRQALEASFADPVEIPITIAQQQSIEEFGTDLTARLGTLRETSVLQFVNPIGAALRQATDPNQVFDPVRFLTAYAELQTALNESTVNALRIDNEEIIPDDLEDAWADIIENVGEENRAILQASVIDAYEEGGPEAVDALLASLREGFLNADLATVVEQAVAGEPINLDLLANLDDSELELLAETVFGIEVTADTDLDALRSAIGDGDYTALVDVEMNVVDDSDIDFAARDRTVDVTLTGGWSQGGLNQLSADLLAALGGAGGVGIPAERGIAGIDSGGFQMLDAGTGFIADRTGPGVPFAFGGKLFAAGESPMGAENVEFGRDSQGRPSLAVVGAYHDAKLTVDRLRKTGVLDRILPVLREEFTPPAAARAPSVASNFDPTVGMLSARIADLTAEVVQLRSAAEKTAGNTNHLGAIRSEVAEQTGLLSDIDAKSKPARKSMRDKIA